jgi:hypothetical protein
VFDTRSAEEPDSGNTGVFVQPDRPEVVLDNLISAVENLNTVNYLRCLQREGFSFAPSNNALMQNPEVWSNWTYDAEQIYFNNLRASAENTTGHRLQLTNITSEIRDTDTRQIIADYTLRVLHNRGNSGVPTAIYGRFILELQSGEDGLWEISSWSDVAQGNTFSWSDLRANFLSN